MLCVSDLRFTIGEDVAKGLEEVIDKMTSLKAVHEAYAFYSSGIIARKARGKPEKVPKIIKERILPQVQHCELIGTLDFRKKVPKTTKKRISPQTHNVGGRF